MSKLLFAIMCFISMTISSCSSEPKDIALFHQITTNYVQMMAKDEQLFVSGTGGSFSGGPQNDLIRSFRFVFNSEKLVDLREARSITVRSVELMRALVNGNEEIRPFLERYPYPPSGVDLTLVFLPFDESAPYSEKTHVWMVFFMHGTIYYQGYDHGTKEDVTILEETYEEALERNAKRNLELP